jgi:protein-S-isoprenylcysteine O-methyltransferase Ste14
MMRGRSARSDKQEKRFAVINIVSGLLVVAVSVLIAVAGLSLIQRLVPSQLRQEHNDVAGFIYAVLGVIYAVLLALVVIAVWEDYAAARDTVEREASELDDVFRLAHPLPDPQGCQLQELARSYAQVVIDEEWALMAQGRTSPQAWDLLDEMTLLFENVEVRTKAEQVLYGEALDRIDELADARNARLVEADEGIPTVLWGVLVFGGIMIVSFTYLFGLENTLVHYLMVAVLALVISSVLFTIGVLEYPFSGDVRVDPEAFEVVLERFESSKLSKL